MADHRVLRSGAVALALSGLALACGGSHKPAKAPTDEATASSATPANRGEMHEQVVPHFCATKTKLARLLNNEATPAPAPPSDATADSAPPPSTSVTATTRIAANTAYRAVAPGTVLIRSERGMGTGVVIDPKGYVLTNYHVIADGQMKDFISKVSVNFGDLTPTGRMTRQEKTYDGIVVKADPVRDMAIVRVIDPPAPAKLTTVKLAKSAPQIAENVMAVGHAGIGFLWAAKSCSVASVGERQQDASMLAILDCARSDPAQSAEQISTAKKSCDERKKSMADSMLAETQGLAIQTDCATTHGDSGGPLVNAAGELVGLNQSMSVDLTTASFHVHLDEIRDFTAKYGEEGVALIPDPYCDGGVTPTLEDADLDGVPDTLVTKTSGVYGGTERMSVLIDLDQDHFSKKRGLLEPFDAEIALLVIRNTAYVWYDTDGDTHFDLLLVDKDNDGTPELAYRLDADGHIKEDKDALPKHDFSGKFIKDVKLHPRLAKIAAAIGGSKYTSEKMASSIGGPTLPDPLLGGGGTGRALDTDHNGKLDTVFVRGAFSRGLLVDANEDSLGSLKNGDPADDLLKAKKVTAEISVVVQGNDIWASYDTNNDGKFDLTLLSNTGDESFASSAWKLGGPGEMTPAPEHVGRKLMRPGLVAFPRAATALRAAGYDIATDEGLGSLPDALAARGFFRFRDVKGYPKGTVIESMSVTLVDVDHDTKIPAKDADANKIVREGKLDAEVAIVHRGSSDWIYYDTDGDNKFDLVLFVPASGQEPTAAYRLPKGETALVLDKTAVPGRELRTKAVFTNKALNARWKTLAGKLFRPAIVEE